MTATGSGRRAAGKLVLASGMALVLFLSGALRAGPGGKVPWGTDYAAARERALKSGRLLAVYFTKDY